MRLLKLVPDNTNLKFVSLRKWAFGLTLLLSLLAVGLVVTKGLNMGVDFVGGVLIEEKFATPPSIDAVRTEVDRLGVGENEGQPIGRIGGVDRHVPAAGLQYRHQRRVSLDLVVKTLSNRAWAAQHRDIHVCLGHVDAHHH